MRIRSITSRSRSLNGLTAVISRGGNVIASGVTIELGQAENVATGDRVVTVESDKCDVLIAAADYGPEPEIGDRINITMPDGSIRSAAAYVPEGSKQCYANRDPEGSELRVFGRIRIAGGN